MTSTPNQGVKVWGDTGYLYNQGCTTQACPLKTTKLSSLAIPMSDAVIPGLVRAVQETRDKPPGFKYNKF